jgi:hypothetical protein
MAGSLAVLPSAPTLQLKHALLVVLGEKEHRPPCQHA